VITVATDLSFKSKKHLQLPTPSTSLSFYNQLQRVKRAHTEKREGLYYLQKFQCKNG